MFPLTLTVLTMVVLFPLLTPNEKAAHWFLVVSDTVGIPKSHTLREILYFYLFYFKFDHISLYQRRKTMKNIFCEIVFDDTVIHHISLTCLSNRILIEMFLSLVL